MPNTKEGHKKIKRKLYEAFGFFHRFDPLCRVERDYRRIIKQALGIDLPEINKHQATVAMRYIIDTESDDYAQVVIDSMSKMPHAKPEAYAAMMVKHAVISRKRQRPNSPPMTMNQQQSEIINDYVMRKEVQKFSDKNFYRSREWRELRLLILSANRVCKLCGSGPDQGKVMHVDHIKPRSLWPELSLEISNLQLLCADCNLGKSNTIEDRF